MEDKTPKGDCKGDGPMDENDADIGVKAAGGSAKKKKGGESRKRGGDALTVQQNEDSVGPKKKARASPKRHPQSPKVRTDDTDCKKFGKWVQIPIAEKGEKEERMWLGQIKAVGVLGGVEKYSVYFEEDGDYLDYDVEQVPILFVILLCKFDALFCSVVQVDTLYMLAEDSVQYKTLRADCNVSVLSLILLPFAHHVCVFIQRYESKIAKEKDLTQQRQKNKKETTRPRLVSMPKLMLLSPKRHKWSDLLDKGQCKLRCAPLRSKTGH